MPRILVVDDNPDNIAVVSRMLEIRDHQPLSARNGAEALERAKAEEPDLVLMDLSMPVMNGWQAAAAFHADEELSRIPIIAVTGHVTSDEIRRAQEAGCADLVSKPIDFYVLMDKIELHAPAERAAAS